MPKKSSRSFFDSRTWNL